MITWELRYRAARTIDNVLIETFTEKEEEAKALADKFLARPEIAGPSVRFVRLRQILVASSAKEADMAEVWGPKKAATPPARPAPPPPPAKGKPATSGKGAKPAAAATTKPEGEEPPPATPIDPEQADEDAMAPPLPPGAPTPARGVLARAADRVLGRVGE